MKRPAPAIRKWRHDVTGLTKLVAAHVADSLVSGQSGLASLPADYGWTVEEFQQMMLADDPAAAGFTRPQLSCAYQLMDRLPSYPERSGCLINAVSKSFGLTSLELCVAGPIAASPLPRVTRADNLECLRVWFT